MEITVQTVTAALCEGAKQSPNVKKIVAFMYGKSLQITTMDGEMFNVCVVKTDHKINCKSVYEKDQRSRNEDHSSI